jgi:hypothetical protein
VQAFAHRKGTARISACPYKARSRSPPEVRPTFLLDIPPSNFRRPRSKVPLAPTPETLESLKIILALATTAAPSIGSLLESGSSRNGWVISVTWNVTTITHPSCAHYLDTGKNVCRIYSSIPQKLLEILMPAPFPSYLISDSLLLLNPLPCFSSVAIVSISIILGERGMICRPTAQLRIGLICLATYRPILLLFRML